MVDPSELHRALGHPSRPEILRAAALDRLSAKGFATASGGDVRSVAYHFRLLRDTGLLVIVGEDRHRGGLETFYLTAPTAAGDIHELADSLLLLSTDLGYRAT